MVIYAGYTLQDDYPDFVPDFPLNTVAAKPRFFDGPVEPSSRTILFDGSTGFFFRKGILMAYVF